MSKTKTTNSSTTTNIHILIKKFGSILISRPAGKEAYLALQPTVKNCEKDEKIEIDFEGVSVLTPSWADEFVTPLVNRFQNSTLLNTKKTSVKAALETLKKSRMAQD